MVGKPPVLEAILEMGNTDNHPLVARVNITSLILTQRERLNLPRATKTRRKERETALACLNKVNGFDGLLRQERDTGLINLTEQKDHHEKLTYCVVR